MIMGNLCACASNSAKKSKNKPICAAWLMPDSTVCKKLGNRLTSVLFSPQKVKCYHLTGKEHVEKNEVEIEDHYVRDTMICNLSADEISVLQFILLRPSKNYERDSMIVMSPYLPTLEFEFSKKKETAHILVSLSDLSWSVIYDGKRQFNFNYKNHALLETFCKYYLSLYKPKEK